MEIGVMNHLSTKTETDIKTKIIMRKSNPKAYNIDKFLQYHSQDNTVFLFYFVGIDADGIYNKALVSAFQKDLLESTILQYHWAGRASRGVTQFSGEVIHKLLKSHSNQIDIEKSREFLNDIINM